MNSMNHPVGVGDIERTAIAMFKDIGLRFDGSPAAAIRLAISV